MDVTVKELFNFPAGVDVVQIGIQNDLEHHPGVVRATPAFLIQLSDCLLYTSAVLYLLVFMHRKHAKMLQQRNGDMSRPKIKEDVYKRQGCDSSCIPRCS